MAIRNMLLVTRVTGRFARRGGHLHREEEGWTGIRAERPELESRTSDVIVGISSVYSQSRERDETARQLASGGEANLV